jgi:hypothetical protein
MRGSIPVERSILGRIQEYLAHQPRVGGGLDSRRARREMPVEQCEEGREQLIARHIPSHLAVLLRSLEQGAQREPASSGDELGVGCCAIRTARLFESGPREVPHRTLERGPGIPGGSNETHSPADVRAAPADVGSVERASEAEGTMRTGRWVC